MSDESGVQLLIKLMEEIHATVKVLAANQERITQEQQRLAKAIGECGILLTNHGAAILELQHAGLAADEPPQVN